MYPPCIACCNTLCSVGHSAPLAAATACGGFARRRQAPAGAVRRFASRQKARYRRCVVWHARCYLCWSCTRTRR